LFSDLACVGGLVLVVSGVFTWMFLGRGVTGALLVCAGLIAGGLGCPDSVFLK
jgi:hypothetical protein